MSVVRHRRRRRWDKETILYAALGFGWVVTAIIVLWLAGAW